MKEIKITVSTTGEIEISTAGFRGKACKDATKEIERALGLVESDKTTPEFFLPEERPNENSH